MRPTLAWLFALLALLGLVAFLSLIGLIVGVRAADIDPPDDLAWGLIFAGLFGLSASFFFGTLTFIASRAAGRMTVKARRLGLGLLGGVCFIWGLTQLTSAIPYAAAGLALVGAGAAALVTLWRDVRRERREG